MRTRLKPSRNLRQFYEDNSDLFEAIDNQSIEDRAVFDPDKQLLNGVLYTRGLNWWWYTSDKKVKDRQDKRLTEMIKNSCQL